MSSESLSCVSLHHRDGPLHAKFVCRRIRLQTHERPLELAVSIYASDSSGQPAQLVASSGPYVDHVCGAVLSAPSLPLAASGEHTFSVEAFAPSILLHFLRRGGLFVVRRLYRHSVDRAIERIRSFRNARLRRYKARGLSVVARAREPYFSISRFPVRRVAADPDFQCAERIARRGAPPAGSQLQFGTLHKVQSSAI